MAPDFDALGQKSLSIELMKKAPRIHELIEKIAREPVNVALQENLAANFEKTLRHVEECDRLRNQIDLAESTLKSFRVHNELYREWLQLVIDLRRRYAALECRPVLSPNV